MCGWTDVGLTMLLALLKECFPNIQFSDIFYKTKKFITDLGVIYEKIDAYPNNCMLYYKEHANDTSCDLCESSHYKINTAPENNTFTNIP